MLAILAAAALVVAGCGEPSAADKRKGAAHGYEHFVREVSGGDLNKACDLLSDKAQRQLVAYARKLHHRPSCYAELNSDDEIPNVDRESSVVAFAHLRPGGAVVDAGAGLRHVPMVDDDGWKIASFDFRGPLYRHYGGAACRQTIAANLRLGIPHGSVAQRRGLFQRQAVLVLALRQRLAAQTPALEDRAAHADALAQLNRLIAYDNHFKRFATAEPSRGQTAVLRKAVQASRQLDQDLHTLFGTCIPEALFVDLPRLAGRAGVICRDAAHRHPVPHGKVRSAEEARRLLDTAAARYRQALPRLLRLRAPSVLRPRLDQTLAAQRQTTRLSVQIASDARAGTLTPSLARTLGRRVEASARTQSIGWLLLGSKLCAKL